MTTDREFTEYSSLYAVLDDLYRKFLVRREEIRSLLEETAACRKAAFAFLAKANRLTRHLTGRQRQTAGITYLLSEIKARVNRKSPVLSAVRGDEDTRLDTRLPEFHPDSLSRREIRRRFPVLLSLVDGVKAKLLHLDLLELRCRELLLSVGKAMEAFRHEFRVIKRGIFPLGVFSFFYRFVRFRAGKTFFTSRDMEDVAALGSITGFVLKIADAPLM